MSFGVNLIARLVVVTTLINYSFGSTPGLTPNIAADTTAGSSAYLTDISTAADSADSITSVSVISTAADSADSTTSVLAISTTADSAGSITGEPAISTTADSTDSITGEPAISTTAGSSDSTTSISVISTTADSADSTTSVSVISTTADSADSITSVSVTSTTADSADSTTSVSVTSTTANSADSITSVSVTSTTSDSTHSTQSSSEISLVSSTDAYSTASSPTSIGTGDNTTEDAVSTASTSSSSSTSTPTSTSIPSTIATTITPPAGTQEPDFGAAPLFEMTFTIGFNRTWNESFSKCSESQDCIEFRIEIQREIDSAFIGCLGYENGSIEVIRFFAYSEISEEVRSVRQLQAVQFAVNGNDTYAEYNASFDNKIVLSRSDDVVTYIGSSVANELVAIPLVINGSTDGMAGAAEKQMAEFSQSSCVYIGMELCSSICYPCTNDDMYSYNVSCQTKCDENHICTADQYNTISCVCKVDYLPFGDDCVHENVIIGISAGVGGAIILGLLIAAIVLGCKLSKKDKQYDHLVESNSHHRAEAYEMTRHGEDRKSVSADNVELHAVGHAKAEPVASAKADHDGHDGHVSTEMEKENHHHHHHDSNHQPEKKTHAKADDESIADYDEAPAANNVEMLNKQSDHYRSLYYTMPDNPGSPSSSLHDPYAYFVPHLNKIDVNKEYHIKRPQIQQPPANGAHNSHYNHGTFF